MGELWRSEEMQLVQLFLQSEAAHDTVDELGKLGLIQFRDLNPLVTPYQRNFINEVKRADEMLRKLRSFDKQIETFNKEAKDLRQPQIKTSTLTEISAIDKLQLEDLDVKFEVLEKQVHEMTTHQETLNRNMNQLLELQQVLKFAEVARSMQAQSVDDDEGKSFQLKFGSLSGVIAQSKFQVFEKILFRATRGNLYLKYDHVRVKLRDPYSGALMLKNVFVIFFQGERLEHKIKKICESFTANIYPCPETHAERTSLMDQVAIRLQETQLIIERGWEQRFDLLSNISLSLNSWTEKVTREKSIYHMMNLFNYDHGRRCLIAEGWVPLKGMERVQIALREGKERSGAMIPSILNVVPTNEVPPTYFKTNNLSRGFQDIVNSYGTARYQEVNPAVFTIVTFPFEFGIMFGDVGHGTLLLISALFMIYMERSWGDGKNLNEMIRMPYGGRYTILLMSIFAIYIGALYNEMFALPMNFGSNWMYDNSPPYNTFYPSDPNWTYPFGVDPVWKGASNELTFYNSLKMKAAVVIGVCQMTLGLILHLLNGIYFKQIYDILFEFVPRVTFLLTTFGYLVAMIFIKWNTDYRSSVVLSHNAPILLNELIYMFLPGNPNTKYPLFEAQHDVQPILVAFALVSIPMMMFPKPILLLLDDKAQKKGYTSIWALMLGRKRVAQRPNSDNDSSDAGAPFLDDYHQINGHDEKTTTTTPAPGGHGGGHGHDGEFDFGEAMVHQGLETIEFVLGCVSHTASYLRLWALSLAHSELATVFWERVWGTFWPYGIDKGYLGYVIGGLGSFVAFSVWFACTIFIILGMESLSAFLHSLRLHWVEFQSKFYRGDGYPFLPFTYVREED